MKKRKMMALLTAAAVMCSLAVPALADEAEGDLIPITFCRTADPLVEANVFANMEGATYEKNIWTDLIAEKLGYEVPIFGSHPAPKLQRRSLTRL